MKNIRATFPEADRKKTAGSLNPVLLDLIDLGLIAKQAHWAVIGPTFKPFHEDLDGLADFYRKASDEVAERMLALGVAPNGHAAEVAKGSQVEDLPAGFISDKDLTTMLADRVAEAAKRARTARETAGKVDPVTEDILIELIQEMEKQLWMLQAQES